MFLAIYHGACYNIITYILQVTYPAISIYCYRLSYTVGTYISYMTLYTTPYIASISSGVWVFRDGLSCRTLGPPLYFFPWYTQSLIVTWETSHRCDPSAACNSSAYLHTLCAYFFA